MLLDELIKAALEGHDVEMHVSMEGRIDRMVAKDRADIKLQAKGYVPDGVGGMVPEDFAILPNVPIEFPNGGGFFCSFPLAKDDIVRVVFLDLPLGAWLQKGSVTESGDIRAHHIGNAVAYPGGARPKNASIGDLSDSAMRLGKDGTANAQIEITSSGGKLGRNASKEIARKNDNLTASTGLAAWALAVETALNSLSAPVATPFTSAAGVAGGLGSINQGSSTWKAED